MKSPPDTTGGALAECSDAGLERAGLSVAEDSRLARPPQGLSPKTPADWRRTRWPRLVRGFQPPAAPGIVPIDGGRP